MLALSVLNYGSKLENLISQTKAKNLVGNDIEI